MSEQHIFQQGLDLLVFGMGSVFFFLGLLITTTHLMSAIVNRFFATDETHAQAMPNSQNDAHLTSILQAAIDQHRTR